MCQLLPDFYNACFSVIQPQPVTMSQSGAFNTGDGYGLVDPYKLGTKKKPTYVGTGDELRMLVAMAAAWGQETCIDYVFHQYEVLTTDPTQRFPKTASCYVGAPPGQPVDDVFSPEGNFNFGYLASMQRGQYNSTGSHTYMADETVKNLKWLFDTTDAKRARYDDTKGSYVPLLNRLVNEASQGKFIFGECFSGNNGVLTSMLQQMNWKASTIDFPGHWTVQDMCDNPESDYRKLDGAGLRSLYPFNSVGLIDNADTDSSNGQQVISNKVMAYAFIVLGEGEQAVYYKDWSTDKYCYGLEKYINNINWMHEFLSGGKCYQVWKEQSLFAFCAPGYGSKPGLIAAFNRDTYNNRTITVQTPFGANRAMQRYSITGGPTQYASTDGSGKLTIEVPCNAFNNGVGLAVWGPAGYSGAFSLTPFNVNQTIEFAADLEEIGAAKAGMITTLAELYIEGGTTLTIAPTSAVSDLAFELEDLNGNVIPATKSGKHILVKIPADNLYVLVVGNEGTADRDGKVTVNYRAPKYLLPSMVATMEARHAEQHAEIHTIFAKALTEKANQQQGMAAQYLMHESVEYSDV